LDCGFRGVLLGGLRVWDGLFAEVILEGKEYHYCNGELHKVYDDKGNEIWRIKEMKKGAIFEEVGLSAPM